SLCANWPRPRSPTDPHDGSACSEGTGDSLVMPLAWEDQGPPPQRFAATRRTTWSWPATSRSAPSSWPRCPGGTMSWLSSHETVAIIAIVDRPGETAAFEAAASVAGWRFERCLTHELSVDGFVGPGGRDAALVRACRDLGGYRIVVYEMKRVP
ncbi:unnamed protein product, partial [Prorocentrum cordatum]